MNDQVAMRVLDGPRDVENQCQAPIDIESTLLAILVDRQPVDVVHNEVRQFIFRDAAIEQPGDVVVHQARQYLAFYEKTSASLIGIEAHWQNLERRLMLELLVSAFRKIYGTHATTALCLEWLDAHMHPGSRVIDYGCGSGILAIAALKLGATQVNAVDIDPQALQATRENARRNGISAGLSVQFPAALLVTDVDLVIANILANPLIELSSRLAGLLAARGEIIMTGILAEQAESVMAAYRDMIEFDQPVPRDEWVLLTGRKR